MYSFRISGKKKNKQTKKKLKADVPYFASCVQKESNLEFWNPFDCSLTPLPGKYH